jgi:hypothetical protein
MGRTTKTGSSPGFVADWGSIARNGGRQIDFTKIGAAFEGTRYTIKAAATAAIGAVSITVDALPVALPLGTILNFGEFAQVLVTVNDADVNATETAITVVALPGPLPAGAILQFSGSGAGFAKLTAAALAGATSITVEALPEDIDNGATATFEGGTIQARLTAAAAKAATAITVDDLQFAVPDNAEAIYSPSGALVIKSGTIMAELSGGKIIPRSAVTGGETAIGFLVGDAEDGALQDALSGYGLIVGGVVYGELLPDRNESGFATWIAEINTAGPGLRLETYSDNRAS